MFVLDAREGHVTSLAFAPDAAGLYACHGYGGVHAWNLADRTASRVVIGGEAVVEVFVLHPGGRWAFGLVRRMSAGTYRRVLDLPAETGRPFNFTHSRSVATAPDGSRLVTLGYSRADGDRPHAAATERLYGWSMTTDGPEYEWHQDVPHNVGTAAVAALGADRFATAEAVVPTGRHIRASIAWRMQVAVRRAGDGAALAALDFPHRQIHQLLAPPDGTKLVARLGTELRVWDATNWALPPRAVEGKLKSDMEPPAAAFTPSGHYLLLANGGPSVVVYDARTWKEVRKWKWGDGALRAVAVSPDGTLAAAGGPRGTVVVWDLDL